VLPLLKANRKAANLPIHFFDMLLLNAMFAAPIIR
jgi:hypothetical protein